MSYNSQDALNFNAAFGNKWSFNYATHLTENTAGLVTLFMPDGRQDNYIPDGNGTGNYNGEAGTYNKLVKLGQNSFELRFQQGGKYVYGVPSGSSSTRPLLLSVEDRWGYALQMVYDANLNLTSVTDALGSVTTLEYDANGRITRAWTPDNRTASWKYDQYGNLTEVIDMEGHAFQFTFDGYANVISFNTAQGLWKLAYTDNGTGTKSVTLTDPLNQNERFYHTGAHVGTTGYQYSYTDKRGMTTAYNAGEVIEGKGKITKVKLPNGDISTMEYDPNTAQVNSVTDAGNRTTTATYNNQGNPLTVTDAKARTYTYTYDSSGLNLTQVKDPQNNVVATLTYNAYHQPTSVSNRLNQSTNFSYTNWGAPATTTNIANQTSTNVYDTQGHLTGMQFAGATLASFTYDAAHRLKTTTDAGNLTTTYAYNNWSSPFKVES